MTGAPGESTCTACHSGTAVNGGAGSVKITLPGAATYIPGVTQRITVPVSDPTQRRWGFGFTARPASNLTGGQAGDLVSVDGNTRVTCSNGVRSPAPLTPQSNSSAVAPALSPSMANTSQRPMPKTALLGKPGLFASAPTLTTAVKPGETIVIYGTGFGPTNPTIAPGKFTDRLAPIAGTVTASIGGSPSVSFAGLGPPFSQVYQFNIVKPGNVPAGDQPVVINVNGTNTPTGTGCCFITIAK